MRRRCRSAGTAREFQFPGDLWLPRRENRCRQPPNNHTSYDYHTPGVYTRAPYPRLSFTLSSSLSLSLVRTHARSLARPPRFHPPIISLSLSLSRPSSFRPALLQITRRTYPFRLRKIARDLNYCALLLSLSRTTRVPIRYFFSGGDSNYPTRCELLFIGRSYRIFRSPFLSQC